MDFISFINFFVSATKMYEAKKYSKAIRLFEQIAPAYKGKPSSLFYLIQLILNTFCAVKSTANLVINCRLQNIFFDYKKATFLKFYR